MRQSESRRERSHEQTRHKTRNHERAGMKHRFERRQVSRARARPHSNSRAAQKRHRKRHTKRQIQTRWPKRHTARPRRLNEPRQHQKRRRPPRLKIEHHLNAEIGSRNAKKEKWKRHIRRSAFLYSAFRLPISAFFTLPLERARSRCSGDQREHRFRRTHPGANKPRFSRLSTRAQSRFRVETPRRARAPSRW